ncbi:MAG: VWA domain-containing protein [Vicinamibacterales bacterium]
MAWLAIVCSLLVPLAPGVFNVAAQQGTSELAPIPLRLIVTDARGHSVPGLTAADIEITEDTRHLRIQSITFTSRKAPRQIALLLDDFHVSPGINSARARAALLEFMRGSVRTDDLLYVMKPLDPASSIAPVDAPDGLRRAITRFEGRKGNYAPLTPYEADLMSVAPPTAPRQRAQVARAAMQALAARLAAHANDEDARKAVIVVTEGFAADERGSHDRMATLRIVARSARLSNVAVYVLDPSAEPQAPSPFTDQWQMLTAQTGGILTPAAAPLEAALTRIATDLDEHYIVTIPPVPEDGVFHPLKVAAKRRDLTVRAPSGFWTPIAAERLSPSARPAMSTYLRTPHLTGLIQPWFRMARAGGGRTQVTFSWAPRGSRLKEASVEFSAVTFDGVPLYPSAVIPRGTGQAARATFEALPGAIQVTMAVKDNAGKLVDTEVRYLDVPTLDTRSAAITAVDLVRTRTVREFERVQLEPDAMPADTRDFYREDRVIVRVSASGGAGTAAGVTARLLTPSGQAIMTLSPLPDLGGMSQFDLPLARYPRGDYRIEVRAADATSSTAQLIPFRLIG